MSQRYNDNTKRPKPKDNQLQILKNYAFCQKIQYRALGPGESTAAVIYENISKMLLQLEHSSHIVKVVVEAIC